MTHVAFAVHQTESRLRPEDRPDPQTLAAWRQHDITVSYIPWRADVSWQQYDAVLVRTVYGYDVDGARFIAWAQRAEAAGTRLLNDAALVVWNADKHYLRELAQAGFATIPTRWLAQRSAVDLAMLHQQTGWDELVIKPTISAGARDTWRSHITDAPAHNARLNQLLQRHNLMVQPFLPEIGAVGEWSAVYLQGRLSHSFIKRPRAGDWRVQPQYGGTIEAAPLPHTIQSVAVDVLRWLPTMPLYARVDGVMTTAGFALMELELIEPYLYLDLDPQAAARYWDTLTTAMTPRPCNGDGNLIRGGFRHRRE